MRYLDVSDLSFYYDEEPVLEKISYHVDAGEFVILTGENGAAKSTLIKASLGLLQPAAGQVTMAKTNTEGAKLSVGYIPQQVASFNAGFPSTVLELVQSGRFPRGRWFKGLSSKDKEHVRRALEAVGMWEMRHKRIGALSGGQKQRIFWWFRWQRWRFRFLIAGGMSCFVIFFGILYFGISPNSTYEMLYLPIFFRGLGMLTLIIAFALFAVEDLNPKFLLSNAFFLIIFRSVLTPIMATSFYRRGERPGTDSYHPDRT